MRNFWRDRENDPDIGLFQREADWWSAGVLPVLAGLAGIVRVVLRLLRDQLFIRFLGIQKSLGLLTGHLTGSLGLL